jgi:hypothetical protein
LNDITNQRVDAVTDALNPQSELDPVYIGWLPKMKNLPSTVYPFKPGSWRFVQKPGIPAGAFEESGNIKSDIREAVAADQVVKGVSSDQRSTATEIRAQLNQAGCVGQQMTDLDAGLAVGCELRPVSGDRRIHVQLVGVRPPVGHCVMGWS